MTKKAASLPLQAATLPDKTATLSLFVPLDALFVPRSGHFSASLPLVPASLPLFQSLSTAGIYGKSDPLLLAVPAGHPLVGTEHFTPEDLAAQKWIGVMQKEGVSRQDAFIAACAKVGFAPEISREASEPLAALGLVVVGFGMKVVQRSQRHQAPEGVTLHEVPWLNYRSSLWVAWYRIDLRPLVRVSEKP